MYAFGFLEEKPERENMKKYEKPSRDVKEKPPKNSNSNPMVAKKVHYKNIHQIHCHQ